MQPLYASSTILRNKSLAHSSLELGVCESKILQSALVSIGTYCVVYLTSEV